MFIRVEYESSQSRIICQFLNKSDVSLKSCSVQYGNCDDSKTSAVLPYSSHGNSTMEAPNIIELIVDPERLACYLVTASSDSFSILIEGTSRMKSAGKFILSLLCLFNRMQANFHTIFGCHMLCYIKIHYEKSHNVNFLALIFVFIALGGHSVSSPDPTRSSTCMPALLPS